MTITNNDQTLNKIGAAPIMGEMMIWAMPNRLNSQYVQRVDGKTGKIMQTCVDCDKKDSFDT